jgi:hypothetical protein
MLLLSIARIVLLWIVMAVPPERKTNWTPCRPRKAASVTMNDGMPSFATSVPRKSPTTKPTPIPARTAQYHGQPCCVSSTAMMVAQTPLVKPAERSISPNSKTKTRPIAMMVTCAPCWNRLAKLRSEKKLSFAMPKMMQATTRPATAGSAPTSPPRTLAKYSRT